MLSLAATGDAAPPPLPSHLVVRERVIRIDRERDVVLLLGGVVVLALLVEQPAELQACGAGTNNCPLLFVSSGNPGDIILTTPFNTEICWKMFCCFYVIFFFNGQDPNSPLSS